VTWVIRNLFGPLGDSVSVDVRLVHGLRQTYHRLRNRLGRSLLLGDEGQVEARFSFFGDGANLDVSVDAR
jgi:hypothetical protein